MRRAAIAAFFCAIALYPLSFALTVRSIRSEVTDESVPTAVWYAGRALAVAVVALFALSIALPVFTDERARRIWWVVPAAVMAIIVAYFDLIGFGFNPSAH